VTFGGLSLGKADGFEVGKQSCMKNSRTFHLLKIICPSTLLFFAGCADVKREKGYEALSKKREFSDFLKGLEKKGVVYHSIVGEDEETNYVRIEIREVREEHTSRLETFYFDPKTEKCFIQDPVDLVLREIQ